MFMKYGKLSTKMYVVRKVRMANSQCSEKMITLIRPEEIKAECIEVHIITHMILSMITQRCQQECCEFQMIPSSTDKQMNERKVL